jgi:hypothetical protein
VETPGSPRTHRMSRRPSSRSDQSATVACLATGFVQRVPPLARGSSSRIRALWRTRTADSLLTIANRRGRPRTSDRALAHVLALVFPECSLAVGGPRRSLPRIKSPRRALWARCDQERSWLILPKVRDPRFVTIRRGGTLTDSDHHLLALWAASRSHPAMTRPTTAVRTRSSSSSTPLGRRSPTGPSSAAATSMAAAGSRSTRPGPPTPPARPARLTSRASTARRSRPATTKPTTAA